MGKLSFVSCITILLLTAGTQSTWDCLDSVQIYAFIANYKILTGKVKKGYVLYPSGLNFTVSLKKN